jgi:hypothetical protein
MPADVRMTLRLPTDIAEALRQRATAEDRSLNGEIVALLRQVLFPSVEADAYRDMRRTLGAMPRYTFPRPFGRRSRGNG